MLESGNDAAVALAEYYSGSVEAFAKVMNDEAKKLGATKSNFVNPSGYPDDNHYTTIYDMYLIFAQAISLEKFTEVINSAEYTANYKDANGTAVTKEWKNTCKYILDSQEVPTGFTVVGGKTGTTKAAGGCLLLYSINSSSNDEYISVVMKSENVDSMYEDKNIMIHDLEDIREIDPLQYENLKRQNIHSIVVVPLYDNDAVMGFYGIDNLSKQV